MRYHNTPMRMSEIKIVTLSNAGENVEKLDHSHIVGGNVKWCSHSGKYLDSFL